MTWSRRRRLFNFRFGIFRINVSIRNTKSKVNIFFTFFLNLLNNITAIFLLLFFIFNIFSLLNLSKGIIVKWIMMIQSCSRRWSVSLHWRRLWMFIFPIFIIFIIHFYYLYFPSWIISIIQIINLIWERNLNKITLLDLERLILVSMLQLKSFFTIF